MTRKWGWRRDLPDHRDLMFTVPVPPAALPTIADLRPQCPAPFDQGQTNSCTGNAAAAAVIVDKIRQGIAPASPSRLFLYYNGRATEHAAGVDGGATIRDVVKGAARWGYPAEGSWPFEEVLVTQRPAPAAYAEARPHAVKQYLSVPQNEYSIRQALAQGCPVVFGVSVYESFERRDVVKSGDIPMPKRSERLLGGHAILLVGYDDGQRLYRFLNSWGTVFGQSGFGTLSYEYVHNPRLAGDFWVIKAVV